MSDKDLVDGLHGAIADTLTTHDGPQMVTRWVAVIETVGIDGERYLWSLQSKGLMHYDALGLHTYATQVEQAATVHEEGAL